MLRYDRLRFALLGFPAFANAVALMLVAMGHAFRINGMPLSLVASALCLGYLGMGCVFAVKRGRDLGWPPLATALIVFVCAGTGPVLLLLAGVLAFMPARASAARYGAAPAAAGIGLWVRALALAALPWLVLVIAKIMVGG